jgi:hypothetical protein
MIKNKPTTCLMFSNGRFMALNRESGDGETFPEGPNGYQLAHSLSKNEDVSCSSNALEQIKLFLNNEIDVVI